MNHSYVTLSQLAGIPRKKMPFWSLCTSWILTGLLLVSFQLAKAATFTVTNFNDIYTTANDPSTPEVGNLRWAIMQANATSGGPHIINFSGSGQINLGTYFLPTIISAGLLIDGYTATGAIAGPIGTRTLTVTINTQFCTQHHPASGVTISDPLVISANNVTIRGLVINGNTNQRNLIRVTGSASNVKIQGNFIGTNPAGTAMVGSNFFAIYADGVLTSGASSISNLLIGTDGDGTNDAIEGNLLNGPFSSSDIIRLYDIDAAIIAGNIVGLNRTGTARLGDPAYPIDLTNCINSRVGSNGDGVSDALERNVAASARKPAVALISNSPGGTSPIGGPTRTGFNSVAGNYLGTDITGLINLNAFGGIGLLGADNNYLGAYYNNGTVVINAATRNVMTTTASNGTVGACVDIGRNVAQGQIGSNNNLITNNYIGVGADGTTALPLGLYGVYVNGSANNTISNNIVANGGWGGVGIEGNFNTPTNNNKITTNSIYSNSSRGIRLENISDGNDGVYNAASNTTANRYIDYPIITTASQSGASLSVAGYIGNVATGSSTFGNMTVEIFAADNTPANQNHPIISGGSTVADHGEGRVYLGSLTSNANGLFSGTLTLTAPQQAALAAIWNNGITATTTSLDAPIGNTSEFGPNILPTAAISISGTVFNDVNGLTDNTVNGTAINGTSVPQAGASPVPVYVSLVSGGSVVATVPVSAAGTYSFTSVSPGSYSVVLTTNSSGSLTPSTPTSWTNTGEKLGTGTGSDGTPNGVLAGITVAGTNVTDANFAIEQLPTAGTGVNTVANAGGTTPVTVPANTFTNTTPSSDVTPGTVTSIRITSFPSNVTSLTINGTVYTASSPQFTGGTPTGVVVPTDGSGNPTVPVLVDPTNDATPVVISFKAIDNAGKESTNTGTATLNFSAVFAISGNVLDDGNGLTDGLVNTFGASALNPVNGTSLDGTPLYVRLVNSSGIEVAMVPVNSTGGYSFTGVTADTYSVVLSTNPAGSLTPSLPTSWTNTGENLGTASGNDGTVNGILTGITVTTTPVTNANFGIDKAPVVVVATDSPRTNPGGTTQSPVTAAVFSGSDQEDGTYPTNLTGRDITLTPATNGTLYYNGTPVSTTTTFANFDPTKVSLDPTATGATSGTAGASPDPTFTYVVTDNAGVSSVPATVRVPFTAPIPDLAPIIYALPAAQYGTTNFSVVVDVFEVNNVASSGLVTVYVSKDPLVNLSFTPGSAIVGGKQVNNTIWTFTNTNPDFYILTTNQVISGGGKQSFGLTGVLTPGNTQGSLTISTTIVGGSGGEVKIDNNSDADKIDYFKK